MTQTPDGGRVELLLALERDADGRVSAHLRRTAPPADYGTVELSELAVLLEAVLEASAEDEG